MITLRVGGAARVAVGVTALALLVGGCGAKDADPEASASASASSSESPEPTEEASASAAPADPADDEAMDEFYDQKLSWKACNSGFQCTKLKVPVDYADPEGDTIKLSLIRLKSTGAGKRLGSLVINPGGPGGSGVEYAQSAKDNITAAVRGRYDVVGFDPRGVGTSAPIDCLTDAQLDVTIEADATPNSDKEVAILEREAERLAKGCEKRSGDLLPHIGTYDVARDVDVMRAVLGDKKLNYLGKSYGTYIGAVYAELFPDRVGRVVLDGAIDPSLSSEQITLDQAEGFQIAYENFVEGCLDLPVCALGDTKKEVMAGVDDLLEELDSDPIETNTGRELNESLAMIGILVAMYDEGAWGVLIEAIESAQDGDGSTLLAFADIYTERGEDGKYKTNANEVIYAVNCLDHPGDDSPEDIKAKLPELTEVSPLWGEFIGWGNLPCHYWPEKSDESAERLTAAGAAPIVVVGTTRDPATPFAWAEGLAEQLESGVLLAYNGDGHTAYGRGNTCIDNAVDAYLLKGNEPKDGKRCG